MNGAASDTIALTVFTNDAGTLAKTFNKGPDGKLVKTVAAEMNRGIFETVEVSHLDAFLDLIDARAYGPSSANAYGITDAPRGKIAARDAVKAGRASGARARINENWHFPAGRRGILMLDFDPPPADAGHDALRKDWSRAYVDRLLCETLLWWKETRRGWLPSNSGEIRDAKTGKLLSSSGGLRCYIEVDDAAQIRAIGQAIFRGLVEAGHGFIVHAINGRRLLRTLIDATVWQPERLDFAWGAALGPELAQERVSYRMGGDVPTLATTGKGCSDDEWKAWRKNSPVVQKLMRDAEPAEKQMHSGWVEREVAKDVGRGIPEEQARKKVAHASRGELTADFILITREGRSITVGELLAIPKVWDHCTFRDPFEHDYAGGADVAIAFLIGQKAHPILFSQVVHQRDEHTPLAISAGVAQLIIYRANSGRQADDHRGKAYLKQVSKPLLPVAADREPSATNTSTRG